jgi:hypothetical protein
MQWNATRFEWEGEDREGVPIAVAGEAFMSAVADYLLAVYGTAERGYTDAQRDEAHEALHQPGAWHLGIAGVRPLARDQ